jgi:hypothetical protein
MSAHSDYSESPFELESILRSQFFEGRNKNEALEPIKRLMLAVLTDAVRCYQVGADAQKISRRRAFREAEEWLFRSISDGPFSFENVCCTLGIAPNYLSRCPAEMARPKGSRSSRHSRPSLASGDVSETNDNRHSQQVSVRC